MGSTVWGSLAGGNNESANAFWPSPHSSGSSIWAKESKSAPYDYCRQKNSVGAATKRPWAAELELSTRLVTRLISSGHAFPLVRPGARWLRRWVWLRRNDHAPAPLSESGFQHWASTPHRRLVRRARRVTSDAGNPRTHLCTSNGQPRQQRCVSRVRRQRSLRRGTHPPSGVRRPRRRMPGG